MNDFGWSILRNSFLSILKITHKSWYVGSNSNGLPVKVSPQCVQFPKYILPRYVCQFFFFPIPTVFDFQYKIQLAFGRRKKFKQSDCVVRDGRILKIIFTQPFYVLREESLDRIEVLPYILVWFIPIS